MKRYDGISIRSYASFREEARAALKGKWKPALLVFLVLMLMTGAIIGANFSYSTSTEIAPYWELEASIGPFTTYSIWKNGELYRDYATYADFFILPYNPLFVATAALTALLFFILTPITMLGQMRLELNLLDGITPDFSVLHTSVRKYWLYVRTELLALWSCLWPMLMCMLAGIILAVAFPDLPIIPDLFLLSGFVLLIVRALSYAATVYLIVTRPDMTARKAVKTSRQMMKGRKWRYFCLGLTFFGWELLAAVFIVPLTFIFGKASLSYFASPLTFLILIPLSLYMYTAYAAFLRDADSRMNGQTPTSDMVDALAASKSPADAEPFPEAPAQAEESPEEDQSFSTPDDPWADDEK